jgi:hypothetical protein
MRFGFVVIFVLASAGSALAWDSRCYLAGGAQCKEGPATARSRWIGPSDEHRALLELGRIFGGLPSSTKNDFTLPVFTSDTEIDVVFSGGTPPPPFQSAPPPNAIQVTSLRPVDFIDAQRTQTRTMSFPEFAQLPDHAFSLWDWALGNETCPLDENTEAVACHEFKTHMGSVNSNHFVPQSAFFYAYYHQLALDRAADCKKMIDKLDDARARFAEFPIACEQEALVLEAVGQHFLQDAWASGHMWERWGSPDAADFPSPTRALLVAMTSGLIHGARAVLEDLPAEAVALLGTTEYHFDDPLNAPAPAVGFRAPGDLAPQAGVGDLYLTDLIAQGGASFPAAFNRLFSCEAAGLRAVYEAAGEPEGPLGELRAGLTAVDPTSDTSCFGQRDTNAAMEKGIGLDFSTPDGTPVRLELDALTATLLVPILSTQAGGAPTEADKAQYQVDMAHIVSIARLTAGQDPNGVTLASGGLPPLLGIESNGSYVKNPLAPYIDPPLPWPGGTGTAADRADALARTFHRAHAIDWCNAFHAGSSLDVEALRTRAETLRDDPSASVDEQTAACAVCKEFAVRHLRVGTDAANYDHAREPLCNFLADDPAGAQFAYQQGAPSDPIPALAATYCGCGLTVTVEPSAATVQAGDTQQFTATVHGTADQRVQWTVVGGGGSFDEDEAGLFIAGNVLRTVTVRATSLADTTAFGEAAVTVTPTCGKNFSKELTLGNHIDVQSFEIDDQAGVIDETLPSNGGFDSVSTGNVDLRSITLSADDPDTRNDVEPNGRVTGVAAIAAVGDGIVLNASDPALQDTQVMFDVSVRVTASITLTGDHALGQWSVFGGGINKHAFVSTTPGQSNGDPSGGTFTASLQGTLGTRLGIGFSVSASGGVACDPAETCPPPPGFTGSTKVQVAVEVLDISNVRDLAGNPVSVSICSGSGTNWGGE